MQLQLCKGSWALVLRFYSDCNRIISREQTPAVFDIIGHRVLVDIYIRMMVHLVGFTVVKILGTDLGYS